MADEVKQPDEMSLEELRADITPESPPEPEVAAPAAPEPEAPAPPPVEEPKKVSFTAGDGTTYTAATPDELVAKVGAALNSTKEAYHDRQRRLDEVAPKPKPEPEAYSHEKYLTLLEKDGLAAAQYVDQFRPEVQKERQFVQQSEQEKQVYRAVIQFKQEFPEYASLETPEVNAAMNLRLRETSRNPGRYEDLATTYAELRIRGIIPEPPVAATRRKPNPPSPQGGAGTRSVPADLDPWTEDMSKLRAHLESESERLRSEVN